ncbi:hypothetical protein JTE90_010654 [Oedothorax gibbosus]|uniref:Uncharacterized protein n=1 Tax=Oedothorax gibbosus TaxID=931172 RepID=A0AAV6TM70_9ARAC|nr:hypothetical protein JTE90_010654 [Oedothorax gibbosus]
MLNFTIKLISDAGYQGEITSISTASQQLEVFSRILKTSVGNILEGGEELLKKNLHEFTRMGVPWRTYLPLQSDTSSLLAQEPKGGSNIKRLSQKLVPMSKSTDHNATPITMALIGQLLFLGMPGPLAMPVKSPHPADILFFSKCIR